MYEYQAEVLRVKDADTLETRVDLGFSVHVHCVLRLDGLDAPELSTAAGQAAAQFVRDLLAVSGPLLVVRTRKDKTEKFGRMLATVLLPDGTSLNQRLLDSGHAVPYHGGPRTQGISESKGQVP